MSSNSLWDRFNSFTEQINQLTNEVIVIDEEQDEDELHPLTLELKECKAEVSPKLPLPKVFTSSNCSLLLVSISTISAGEVQARIAQPARTFSGERSSSC